MEPLNYDSADLWLASLSAAGRSPKTLAIYGYAIGQLREWRERGECSERSSPESPDSPDPATPATPATGETGETGLENLTRLEAMSFTKHLLDRYAANGVRSRIKSLRAFYSWCVAEELCESNPFARVHVSVPDEAQPVLSDEALEKILASAKRSRRDYALLVVLADTGCRKGELASVQMEHLDLRSGVIHFPESKTRIRSVPLSERAIVALGRWLRYRGTGQGSLWAVGDPYSLIKACCERHGDASPHQFRRRFAVTWLQKGGTEVGLQRICGWSSNTMIKLYTQASADVLAADEFRRLMA